MRHEEHSLQCACVRWFRMQWPQYSRLLFAIPNGVRTSRGVAIKAKAEGMVAGAPDLILSVPRGGYGLLAIEMKTKRGQQSAEQKAWQREAEKVGNRYIVVRSIEQFISIINEYLRNGKTTEE
ncbi:MAG: VRR-NUC domain-containing protein [Alistipes sp.]|nr:VRR-NUC domain-containing protein [Alistipes sp.]